MFLALLPNKMGAINIGRPPAPPGTKEKERERERERRLLSFFHCATLLTRFMLTLISFITSCLVAVRPNRKGDTFGVQNSKIEFVLDLSEDKIKCLHSVNITK
jgi:hypothetical protein